MIRPKIFLPPKIVTCEYDGPVAVIGDVHGQLDHLDRLLAKLPEDTKIVVAGDLCDRGPQTREVIDRLIEREATGCLGNHEEWFLTWATGKGFDIAAMSWGAEATLTSYGSVGRDVSEVSAEGNLVPRDHVAWLETLGLAMDLTVGDDTYWVMHAGIPPKELFEGVPLRKVVPHLVLRHRRAPLWNFHHPQTMEALDRPVIMGHLSVPKPYDLGHVIMVDTGCGCRPDGYLTALLLPERRFVDSR